MCGAWAHHEAIVPRLLDRAALGEVYPLVRDAMGDISLERWLRFARSHCGWRGRTQPRGLVAMQNRAGRVLGLFDFTVEHDLRAERILSVEHIIIAQLPAREAISAAIVDAIEQVGILNDCRAIGIHVEQAAERDAGSRPRSAAWIGSAFERRGYVARGVRVLKHLTPGSGGSIVADD